MIIVDEAYIDFATKPGVRTAVPLIRPTNVVVMRAFSKARLAGVRDELLPIGVPRSSARFSPSSLPFGV